MAIFPKIEGKNDDAFFAKVMQKYKSLPVCSSSQPYVLHSLPRVVEFSYYADLASGRVISTLGCRPFLD
jgi:hypothetical protein